MYQQSLGFGRKNNPILEGGVPERFLSEAVAHESKRVCLFVMDSKCEHPHQLFKGFCSPGAKQFQQNFGITTGAECDPRCREFFAKLTEVIDFTIKRNTGVPVTGDHWLV